VNLCMSFDYQFLREAIVIKIEGYNLLQFYLRSIVLWLVMVICGAIETSLMK
jgi:hypothetical protein